MKVGFTGTRQFLETYQQNKVISVLSSLVETMTFGITGACWGVDSFIAHWLADNSDVQQVVIFPSKREYVDDSIWALPRCVFLEMPKEGDERTNNAASYRRRNNKIVELSDRVVAFYRGNPHSGTKMTMNIAERAGKLHASDIHKI